MDPLQFSFSARAEKVDREAGILAGVSMVTIGPVRGHGVYADLKTLESVKTCASTYAGGLKVKMEHGTGAGDIVGVLKDYRIADQHLRADMHLLKKSAHYDHLIEMSETIPDSFGLSISFSGDYETIDLTEGIKVEAMRCREIYSCDVVDSPAANPNGLYNMPKPKTAADPAGESTNAGTSTGAAPNPPADRWAEIQTGLELLIVNVTHAVEALAEMQKQLPTLFEGLATKFADADLLALKRLGALGVPAGTVPSISTNGQTGPTGSPGYAGPKTLHEQLEAIPATEGAKRRAFMREHREALFAEVAAKNRG